MEINNEINNSSNELVVSFVLHFDYNRRTFVPTSSPTLVTPQSIFDSEDKVSAYRGEIQAARARE